MLLIGRAGHDEVVGTLGQAPGVRLVEPGSDVSRPSVADPDRVACVMQTTLSHQDTAPLVEELRKRFPALAEPAAEDICFATRNRQAAIAWLAGRVDVVLVVGDRTSSNSRRLREAASATGTPAYLIGSVAELQDAWLADARSSAYQRAHPRRNTSLTRWSIISAATGPACRRRCSSTNTSPLACHRKSG